MEAAAYPRYQRSLHIRKEAFLIILQKADAAYQRKGQPLRSLEAKAYPRYLRGPRISEKKPLLRNKYHNLKLANIFDLRSTAAKKLLKDLRHNLADLYYTRIRVLIT
jgi:hypothetical protein